MYTTTEPSVVDVQNTLSRSTTIAYTGNKTSYAWPYSQSVDLSKTKSGSKVDDWAERIAKGLPASSAYSLSLTSLKPATGKSVFTFRGPEYTWLGQTLRDTTTEVKTGLARAPLLPSHLVVSQSKAKSAALSSIYKKLESEYQRLNSAASLAEFGDVIRQFGAPAAAIVDLTNRRINRLALERRGLKGSTAFKRLKYMEIAASTYLEYSFGLAPLIDDTRAVAEGLARWKSERSEEVLQKFRSRVVSRGLDATSTQTVSAPFKAHVNALYTSFQEVTKVLTEARAQYTVGLKGDLRADFGSNERLLQILGLKPENLPLALWEIVPWSWLVDYFLNVQQILAAGATNTSSVNWIVLSETLSTVRQTSFMCNPLAVANTESANPGSTCQFTGHGGSYQSIRTDFVRTIPDSLGLPSLTVSIPTESKKLANMISVLFSRRPSSSALWIT